MSTVQIHKEGELIAHLDREGNIVALEVPPTILCSHNIKITSTKVDNPICTKGIAKCTEEISLKHIQYILHCDYTSTYNSLLEKVTIDEKSLNESYNKIILDRGTVEDNRYCDSFDPISKKHGGTYKCELCSLYDVCMGNIRGLYGSCG